MSEVAKPRAPRRVSIFVKVFALVHLFCFVEWSLPNPPQAIANGSYDCRDVQNLARQPLGCLYLANNMLEGVNPLKYYVMSTGVWQSWDMFAPNPARRDTYLDAEVTFADGTKKIVAYPRMYDLSIPEKYVKERYRKYVERLWKNDYAYKWDQFALYMAQLAYTDRNNPPTLVLVRAHWRDVQPMDQPQQENYNSETFIRYIVPQEQLREAKPL